MLSASFKAAYIESLKDNYSLFYDDFHEYGNRETAKHAVYFIPGLNGSPGQMRFAMPAIKKVFHNNVYIKCLFQKEFSADIPVWEKYSLDNLDKKSNTIVSDINDLLNDFDKVSIFVSSHGFFDFVNAYKTSLHKHKNKLLLFWAACSPAQLEETKWHSPFYKLNGFNVNNFEWAAFPNIHAMQFFNKESNIKFLWRIRQQKKYLFKVDLESRFRYLNILWFYASIDCFNHYTSHAIKEFDWPLDITSYILAARNDGYWKSINESEMSSILNKYLRKPKILFKDASHLWVTTPDNIHELVDMAAKGKDININL